MHRGDLIFIGYSLAGLCREERSNLRGKLDPFANRLEWVLRGLLGKYERQTSTLHDTYTASTRKLCRSDLVELRWPFAPLVSRLEFIGIQVTVASLPFTATYTR